MMIAEMNSDFPKTLEQLRKEEQDYKSRNDKAPVPISKRKEGETAETDAFSCLLQQAKEMTARPQKHIPYIMGFEHGKRLFWEILKGMAHSMGKDFRVDAFNRDLLPIIVKYLIGDSGCPISLTKGIFLYGPPGTGKTFLMQAMQNFALLPIRFQHRQFRLVNTLELSEKLQYYGGNDTVGDPLQRYKHQNWCFDDLGQEPKSVIVYGDTRLVMEPIIVKRYANGVSGFCTTHATSNLKPKELEEQYGTRFADRCHDMFNFVFLGGKSRRR